ncbi:phage tail protein [Edaphovirga cremea]|uniref:phage tail-collar fiber domain-containing protein n=1 Tax=Edaphovirga cremea TaxID=2267246 RepID=UPI00398934B5
MAQSAITLAAEQWLVNKVLDNDPARPDKIVFALIPGQNENTPIDRNEGMPALAAIKHTADIVQFGAINKNAVVYSSVLDTTVGDWEYNWIGLVDSVTGTVIMITHVRTQQKIKTQAGQQGNNLTRNLMIEFDGAAEASQINVTAATWQIDYSARLRSMDEAHRLACMDYYGPAAFEKDSFKVSVVGTTATIQPGLGYVGGLRAAQTAAQALVVVATTSVWIDVSWQGTITGAWKNHVAFKVAVNLADYVDAAGYQHYVAKLASITAGVVTDARAPWPGIDLPDCRDYGLGVPSIGTSNNAVDLLSYPGETGAIGYKALLSGLYNPDKTTESRMPDAISKDTLQRAAIFLPQTDTAKLYEGRIASFLFFQNDTDQNKRRVYIGFKYPSNNSTGVEFREILESKNVAEYGPAMGIKISGATAGSTAGINVSNSQTNTVVIGHNSSATAFGSTGSVVIGYNCSITGHANSVVIGSGSKTNGAGCIAMGNEASTVGHHSFAFGMRSVSNYAYSIAFGAHATTSREYEVSVGNGSSSTAAPTRFLANVTDGVKDSDAVTVRQLNAVKAGMLPGETPIPTPRTTPLPGHVFLLGQAFDKIANPNLATAYPSGVFPDMRDRTILGRPDDRAPLSLAAGQVIRHGHSVQIMQTNLGQKQTNTTGNHRHKSGVRAPGEQYGVMITGTDNDGDFELNYSDYAGDHFHTIDMGLHGHDATVSEFGATKNTVDNIAFNYMVRLG